MRKCSMVIPPFFGTEEWNIPQARFDDAAGEAARTIFSQSNGYQGIRGMLEEERNCGAGPSGGFLAGLYELQTGIVTFIKGKQVLPDCFCRVAKAPDYLSMLISVDGISFLETACEPYARYLNMQTGEVVREGTWQCEDGRKTKVEFRRIVCLHDPHLFVSQLVVTPLNYSGRMEFKSTLDAEVVSSYLGRGIWQDVSTESVGEGVVALSGRTRRSHWGVHMLAIHRLNGEPLTRGIVCEEQRVEVSHEFDVEKNSTYCLEKLVWSKALAPDERKKAAIGVSSLSSGGDVAMNEHREEWASFWNDFDICIEGDVSAQQGIRYCLYQLRQAYREGLSTSVVAKGLTGEGYGLLCFWDSEIYLLPFYLYTMPALARGILMFRYNILDEARHRAKVMGYKGAMFPWMTVHGEDNPSAWECVLGEQHINAAVPYAIHQYVEVTGDEHWLANYGAEIIIENARFWASRVFLSEQHGQHVITQVTGPDEYTEMVNNDCYTNMMAAWTLEYAVNTVELVRSKYPSQWNRLAQRLGWSNNESEHWSEIAKNMYVPWDGELGIHPQDDGFLGLDDINMDDIPPEEFALESNWAWPNVLRYKLLKQPSVVLANFLLHNRFTQDQKKAEYEYYEPKTTHDSSLSPSIHAIMAAELDKGHHAYVYFMRAARLDLDDPKTDGSHLANAGGAWMAIVNGFAGLRWLDDLPTFDPKIPSAWESYSFKLRIRGSQIGVNVNRSKATFALLSGKPLDICVKGSRYLLDESVECEAKRLQCQLGAGDTERS